MLRATPTVTRFTSLLLVSLSLLQLGRVLSSQQLALCLDREVPAARPAETAHHHEAATIPAGTPDNGSYFQHCKDTEVGFMLTSLQPVVLPDRDAEFHDSKTWVRTLPESVRLVENFLSPPFQPPKKSL